MSDVTLGGREFKVLDFARRTVLQDHYLQRYLRQIGADSVLPRDGEKDAAYTVRLTTTIIDSGKAPDLIAGFLLPLDKEEKDFTPAMAAEIAQHIGQCNTPQDREQVITLATEVAFGFFRQGLEQWARSRTFSSPATTSDSPSVNDQVH